MTQQIWILRSIPLQKETRNAWRSAGCTLITRSAIRHWNGFTTSKSIGKWGALINLGNLDVSLNHITCPIFNIHDTIRAISTPIALRRTLNDYIPVASYAGPHWHKGKGYGGKDKIFHKSDCKDKHIIASDLQQHINGKEFRVVTVGDVVVQAARKEPHNGIVGKFDWYWVGIDGIRTNGIIPHVKSAITNIPNWEHTVLGWDIIVDNNSNDVFTIEINTSPGTNDHTAQRIINQVRRVI